MSVHIRPALIADYQAITLISRESQALHAEAHPEIFQRDVHGLTEEYVRNLIEGDTSMIYVAEVDGQIAGYMFLEMHKLVYYDIFYPQNVAHIPDIAISEQLRGQGIGHQLFEKAVQWAREQHADRLELQVWEFNQRAISFYQRHGMQTLSRNMSLDLK